MIKNYGSVTVLALQSLGLRIGDGHLDINREASDESGSRPMMIMITAQYIDSQTWVQLVLQKLLRNSDSHYAVYSRFLVL
jgi:hypothetical protein